MKKLLILLSSLLLFLFTTSFVLAETSETTNTPSVKSQKLIQAQERAEQKEERIAKISEAQNEKAINLKTRALKEIDRRITSLNKVLTKINGLKKLSSSQKSSLSSQIEKEITSLTDLKAKINAETDLTTLKTTIQSVIKSYRVYLLFIPKIHILVSADELDNAGDKLSSLSAKLKDRIEEAKSAGKDTASLTTLLTDLQNQITSLHTYAQNARNLVMPLTPEGYPGNKESLKEARAMIVKGIKSLQSGKQDITRIIQGLREKSSEPTKTVSPTSSASD